MNAPLQELRVFLVVAELGHFTRAAERLGISQSSLSGAIGRLEKELGTRLFDRHTRACTLSEAGRALLPGARRTVQEWDSLRQGARDLARSGRVGIAAPNAQCALLLPPLIRRFGELHPGVRVHLHDVPEHQVHELVRHGGADLGIATQSRLRGDLAATPFLSDQYVVALPPGHALARRRTLEWSQVCAEPALGYLPDNPVRRDLDQRLAEQGLQLDYAFEVALPWTMVGLVREGLGIGVLTMALRPLVDWHRLELRPVQRPALARTMALLWAPDRSPTPHAAALRDLVLGRAA